MKNTSVLNIYREKDLIDDYSFTSQDYFVHMLRFSHMVDKLKGKNIFDLGCGKHANLLRAITQMSMGPNFKFYIGADYGNILPYRPNYKPLTNKTILLDYIDWTRDSDYDVVKNELLKHYKNQEWYITCFEVLEHMDFESQQKFLYNLSRLMHEPGLENCTCYFSTPNFNGSAAKNHICEVKYTLLEEMFSCVDLSIHSAIGLSTYKRNVSIIKEPSTLLLLEHFEKTLPTPLYKMILGTLLDHEWSNNILYTLKANKGTVNQINICSLKHGKEHQ